MDTWGMKTQQKQFWGVTKYNVLLKRIFTYKYYTFAFLAMEKDK